MGMKMEATDEKEKVEEKNYIVSDSNMDLLRACIETNNAALMIGETGVGKTTLVREVAKEYGKVLVRIPVNGSMGVEEILGKWLAEKGTTKWLDGVLTEAVRKGHWVVMDEINAALPEILFALHCLLDDDRKLILMEKDGEIVMPHEDFRFFATMNPPEEYSGTKDMNKALMSRFTAVLQMEVLAEQEEAKLLMSRGAKLDDAAKLVTVARKLRERKRKDDIFYFCSTRDLVQVVGLQKFGLSLENAVLGAIVNKMSPKEYEIVKADMSMVIKHMAKVPAKTIEELITIVANRDADIKRAVDAAEVKFSKEIAELKNELKKKVGKEKSEKVRDDFFTRLKDLAEKH